MTAQQRCAELEAALSAYVDHEASPQELALVEEHVRTCADCARRLQRDGRVASQLDTHIRGFLGAAPSQLDGPSRSPLRRDAVTHTFRGPPRGPSLWVVVAIAVVVGVIACVVLFRRAPTSAEPTAMQPPAVPDATAANVLVARLDGIVDPAEASYVQRAIEVAKVTHAEALVLSLAVGGGLDAPAARIQEAITESPVPVLGYLPAGSAADPMALRLAGASALRGSTSPQTTSAGTPAELVVSDMAGLLREADGRTVRTASGDATLHTAFARIESVDMEPLELLAHRMLDPTTAYLLFVLGLYAVLVEVSHPGAIVPGVTGLASLIVAIVAFGILSANPLGAVLIVLAIGLMAVDVRALGHGALTLIGIGCLIVGSLLLYVHSGGGSPFLTTVAISPPILIGVSGSGLLLGLGLLCVARGVRQLPPVFTIEEVVGARGVSRGALEPYGVVQVDGQLWSARSRGGRVEPGQSVRVRARRGLILEVEPATSMGAATQKGASR